MRYPRSRELGLLLLTMLAAASDAISYLGLGQVFPANMTGNTALMGIGLATGDYGHATRSAVALGGFVAGAALTGLVWGAAAVRAKIGLTAEACVVAAAGVLWAGLGAQPTGGGRYALIALLGGAMGLQSGVVLGFDVGVSATFITGTWTRVASSIAGLLRPGRLARPPADRGPTLRRQITVVVCYFAAALLAAFLWTHAVAKPAP